MTPTTLCEPDDLALHCPSLTLSSSSESAAAEQGEELRQGNDAHGPAASRAVVGAEIGAGSAVSPACHSHAWAWPGSGVDQGPQSREILLCYPGYSPASAPTLTHRFPHPGVGWEAGSGSRSSLRPDTVSVLAWPRRSPCCFLFSFPASSCARRRGPVEWGKGGARGVSRARRQEGERGRGPSQAPASAPHSGAITFSHPPASCLPSSSLPAMPLPQLRELC